MRRLLSRAGRHTRAAAGAAVVVGCAPVLAPPRDTTVLAGQWHPALAVSWRLQSTVAASGEGGGAPEHDAALAHGGAEWSAGAAHPLSSDVGGAGNAEEDVYQEDFDELEAASQEVHDICYAMIAFLRRADPVASRALFERRVRRGFAESVPEPQRRLLHGHEDRGLLRRNSFRSRKDLEEATQFYLQLGEKLMVLLQKPLLDRLLESAGKGHRDLRSDGVHKRKHLLERASWRTFPHRWFKHAPFEVQQLRADIPESAVKNTRFYRDHATVKYLFTLMEPQHPYRSAIEKRMFEITQHYDPSATSTGAAPPPKA